MTSSEKYLDNPEFEWTEYLKEYTPFWDMKNLIIFSKEK